MMMQQIVNIVWSHERQKCLTFDCDAAAVVVMDPPGYEVPGC